MKFSIRSRIGYLLYLIRRNDKSWGKLSADEQQLVHEANRIHNNFRPDYANPELYQGGRNLDSVEDRLSTLEGEKLQAFLNETNPESVLEIGPGAGFFSKLILDHPSVKRYQAIDIASAFLDFLRPRLETIRKTKPAFQFELFEGDFLSMEIKPVSTIVMYSTVHHIPNRLQLLDWVKSTLVPGGHCFIFEPTHYWPRIISLFGKFIRVYGRPQHRQKNENYSTHHFCTIEEFETLLMQVPELEINAYSFHRPDFPRLTRKVVNRALKMLGFQTDAQGIFVSNRKSVVRFFMQRMFVDFVKK